MEPRVRQSLRHWGPWMVLAYVGLVFVIVYSLALNSRTVRDEAVREAEQSSAKTSAVARCLSSRPQLMAISRHVGGVNELALILVRNTRSVLEQTPRADPQYKVRRRNLKRLVVATNKVKAISSFPVPTRAECKNRTG